MMDENQENQGYQADELPRRRIGSIQKVVIIMMVAALIVGSLGGMWAGIADYFRNREVGWEGLAHQGDEALMTGDYEMAVYHYNQAIELEPHNPDNASLLAGMGTAYYYAGDMRAAMTSFQRALQLDPNHWAALYSTGIIYQYYYQDYQNALVIWEQMVQMAWDDEDILKHIEDLIGEARENLQQIR